MLESISKIQQMLAESKFVEAQKESELVLIRHENSVSTELLQLYFESLKAQAKPLPAELVLSLVEKLLPLNPDEAENWLEDIVHSNSKCSQQVLLLQIRIAEIKGKTEQLYNLISEYQISRFETRTPGIHEFVLSFIQKYFSHDFHIQLQRLALDLLRMDLKSCEKFIQELILSCFEKASTKGTKDKLLALAEVLNSSDRLYHLELYKNFCLLLANGPESKMDYKKVIELIIYMEDFKLQSLLLNFLVKQELVEAAQDYAAEIRGHKNYSYVYFDKYFPQLKAFFFQRTEKNTSIQNKALPDIDLEVAKSNPVPLLDESSYSFNEEEIILAHLIKHQNFSANELLDIAVSFVQSELYHAALKASQLAIENSIDDQQKLKGYYLKVICLLKNGDFRSALDVSLDALTFSKTQNDVLSFMYSQAEAHIRLKEYRAAKSVLNKIISIDAGYRLTKERLERLNAI